MHARLVVMVDSVSIAFITDVFLSLLLLLVLR